MSPLDIARQAVADTGTHYTEGEVKNILANFVEYHEATIAALIASYEKPKTLTVFVQGFEPRNDQLDYSVYDK